MSTEGETPLGFDADIKPLFRPLDRDSMIGRFDLWSYDDVVKHGPRIAQRIKEGTMPCDGPWEPAEVAKFEAWLASGTAP